jgi:hypothetical protein
LLWARRDKAGNSILTGEIVIPSRWRTTTRSGDEPDNGGVTHRIEGTEALLWLTSDMNMYVTIVKDTIAATLPKMAVSVLLQRIIANDMLRRLQKMALGVSPPELRYLCNVHAIVDAFRLTTAQGVC